MIHKNHEHPSLGMFEKLFGEIHSVSRVFLVRQLKFSMSFNNPRLSLFFDHQVSVSSQLKYDIFAF